MNTSLTQMLSALVAANSWSQTDAAREIGTSQATVNRILKGQPDCKGRTYQKIVALYEAQCRESKSPADESTHVNDDDRRSGADRRSDEDRRSHEDRRAHVAAD
jgi:DNA transposition AAA+ family ATPase